MPEIDVQDELVEHFEPSPIPPAARDGSLELPVMRAGPRPHPRLCEQGPCRNYHRFQIQMDAERPRDEKGPGGALTSSPTPFHVQTHHYCYPTQGIEMRLGALPVIECNRWEPNVMGITSSVARAQELFKGSSESTRHQAEIEAWRLERKEIDDKIAAAERAAADDLAAMQATEAEELFFVVVNRAHPHHLIRVTAKWSDSVVQVVGRSGLFREGDNATQYSFFDWRNKRLDPLATVAHAGLTKGDQIAIELKGDQ